MIKKLILGIVFILSSASAFAFNVPQAKITYIEIQSGENYGFRVYLEGSPAMCDAGTKDWAYINESHSNYNTFVSALLAAKMSQTEVIIYANIRDGGFCEISSILLKP